MYTKAYTKVRLSTLIWMALLCLALAVGAGAPALAQNAGGGLSPSQILERVRPAVVTVVAEENAAHRKVIGSGIVVTVDGIVLTCSHVIEDADEVSVELEDGTRYQVRQVLDTDREHDLAILKVSAKKLLRAALGDSDKVKQGDRIWTLGTPLGFELSASEGIVSAVRGSTAIQITAPISPGSSGGPVVNARGEVIGLAVGTWEGGQNINFAVPINLAKPLLASFGATDTGAPPAPGGGGGGGGPSLAAGPAIALVLGGVACVLVLGTMVARRRIRGRAGVARGGSSGRVGAMLRVTLPDGSTRTMPILEGVIRIGRDPDNDIVLELPGVSRRHAELWRTGNSFLICDLRSSNGTFVDGVAVQTAALTPGSRVMIGDVALALLLPRRSRRAGHDAAPTVPRAPAPTRTHPGPKR
jgi:S1-C subfamily serine protease